jgi:hypothetical protein
VVEKGQLGRFLALAGPQLALKTLHCGQMSPTTRTRITNANDRNEGRILARVLLNTLRNGKRQGSSLAAHQKTKILQSPDETLSKQDEFEGVRGRETNLAIIGIPDVERLSARKTIKCQGLDPGFDPLAAR